MESTEAHHPKVIAQLQRKASAWLTTGNPLKKSEKNILPGVIENSEEAPSNITTGPDNREVLFAGSKNYVSLAVVVDYKFIRYTAENCLEIQATTTTGIQSPSIFLSVPGIIKCIYEEDVAALVATKKEEFAKKQNMKFMEMPADEDFRLPALIELSVDFLKARIYVPGGAGGTFQINLRVLENDTDNVGADGKFLFVIDRPPSIVPRLRSTSKRNLLDMVEFGGGGVGTGGGGLSTSQTEQRSSSVDARKASNWAASLRMLDPEFSKQNLPGELKCKGAEMTRAMIKRRSHTLSPPPPPHLVTHSLNSSLMPYSLIPHPIITHTISLHTLSYHTLSYHSLSKHTHS